MTEYHGFPDDKHLWFVKWIDRVQLPHLSTKSASVSLLLQKLTIEDPKLIHTLKEKQLHEIFSPQGDQKYLVIRQLIGVLPSIEIGAVFQSKKKIGHLPHQSADLTLPYCELSGESRNLSDLDTPPYKAWKPEIPFRALNKFEYQLDKREYSESNCFICKTPTVDYIIPRSVIFKTFYAQHVKMARAFTNGDWPTQRETLVCMRELDSGLKTGVDEVTGEWNIVLQLKVPEELTFLLGVFIFDEYGMKCASSIYSMILKSRNEKVSGSEGWFIDAKIPFITNPKNPLRLKVQGFKLKKYTFAEENSPSRFLVTKIIRSSLPDLPAINKSYVINGQRGRERVEIDEPAPFSSPSNVKPVSAGTQIDSSTDSNPTYGGTDIPSSSFSWIDPPSVRQMQKSSSKSYNKPVKSGATDDENIDKVSPGNNTYAASARPEANIETLIRQPDKKFENLLTVLESLKSQLKIVDYSIVEPLQQIQRIEIGGVSCWNFLDEESRITGRWPRRGWRMKKDAGSTADGELTFGQPRAALVVRIDYTDARFGYWIEIEQKSTSYRSPYITDAPNDDFEMIEHLIEVIARTAAKNLVTDLSEGLEEFNLNPVPVIKAYKHGYIKNTHGDLSPSSVLNFLKKCHEKTD